MTLKAMIESLDPVRYSLPEDADAGRLCYSSRDVNAGDIFFALKGSSSDGHQFIPQALEAGASCIVAEAPEPVAFDSAWVQVRDSRLALAQAAAVAHGDPSKHLKIAGVTGTNGKTTITFLLHYLVEASQHRCGMMGTIHYDVGDEIREASHTTPESTEIQSLLAEMSASDCRGVVMEVSSHALTQQRVASVEFDAGIYTNLSQDHLDYHGGMEAYYEAKALLGEHLSKQTHKTKPVFVINRDDTYGQRMVRRFEDRLNIVTYGMGLGSDFRATQVRTDFQGTQFQLDAKGRSSLVRLPLIGRFNVYNALAVLAAATHGLKLNLREAIGHLDSVPQVPGRLELVEHGGGFKVFVDYAHTPDALENVLTTLQALSPNRLITVFGCGGNRDREKRALMGQVAERYSDFSVLTSDNPRKEDPKAILRDIAKAFRGDAFTVEIDRREAIRNAVEMAGTRDIVLVAGKGHEAIQQFADHSVPFDDRDEVYKALQARDLVPHRNRGGHV